MATAVETLEKLERRITITVPVEDVKAEVEKRLKIRARTARAPGFRPGKVPMKMVAQQFKLSLHLDSGEQLLPDWAHHHDAPFSYQLAELLRRAVIDALGSSKRE